MLSHLKTGTVEATLGPTTSSLWYWHRCPKGSKLTVPFSPLPPVTLNAKAFPSNCLPGPPLSLFPLPPS